MANPLFNKFNQNASQMIPGPFGNMMNLLQRFQQFRNTFQGDPRQQVQNLLNSGQMTQDQFNQLSQMAEQLQHMIGR